MATQTFRAGYYVGKAVRKIVGSVGLMLFGAMAMQAYQAPSQAKTAVTVEHVVKPVKHSKKKHRKHKKHVDIAKKVVINTNRPTIEEIESRLTTVEERLDNAKL